MSDAASWVGDIVAVLAGAAGAIVGGIAIRQTHKDRGIAERALLASEESAQQAKVSADASAASALAVIRQAAADVRTLHHAQDPSPEFVKLHNWPKEDRPGVNGVTATIVVRQDCRMAADLVLADNAVLPIGSSRLVRAGQPFRVHVNDVPLKDLPEGQRLRLKFWVPQDEDEVPRGTCDCGIPERAEYGHWQREFPIKYPTDPRVYVMGRG